MSNTYVEWLEPWDSENHPDIVVVNRMLISDVIKAQKLLHSYDESDPDIDDKIVHDFMVTHWGHLVETRNDTKHINTMGVPDRVKRTAKSHIITGSRTANDVARALLTTIVNTRKMMIEGATSADSISYLNGVIEHTVNLGIFPISEKERDEDD